MSQILKKPNFLKHLELDFNFKEYTTIEQSIHPYPAKFINEIPKTLIENIPIPRGTSILDPFCGSGTTLVEAQKHQIPSIGVDLNPIACLISQVSTSEFPNSVFHIGTMCVEKAKKNRRVNWNNSIPNVDHWFSKDIQIALSSLKKEIMSVDDIQIKTILKLVLSSIIVRVSNQESDTRYAAVDKKLQLSDVFKFFLISLKRLEKVRFDNNMNTPVQILQKDILQTIPSDFNWKVGLVITSPPYPNAYEYWLYHKYRMWWLDYDPLEVKEKEIGARPHFFKKNPHTAETFKIQMNKLFELLDKTLVKSGFACFVIGDSKIHGKIIDNSKIIEDVANSFDMTLYSKFDRNLDLTRKSFNLSYSRLKTEKIIVFKRK